MFNRCSKCYMLNSQHCFHLAMHCTMSRVHQCIICYRSIRPNFKLIPNVSWDKTWVIIVRYNSDENCVICKKNDKDIAYCQNKTATFSAVKNTTKIQSRFYKVMHLHKKALGGLVIQKPFCKFLNFLSASAYVCQNHENRLTILTGVRVLTHKLWAMTKCALFIWDSGLAYMERQRFLENLTPIQTTVIKNICLFTILVKHLMVNKCLYFDTFPVK